MTWIVANTVMLALFAFGAIVQLNDPDPFAWITMYGLALVACVLAIRRRGHWAIPASIAVLAIISAAMLSPRVLGRVPFIDMFGAFEMRDIGIEESREMYGLLIIAVWMVVIAVAARRRAALHGSMSAPQDHPDPTTALRDRQAAPHDGQAAPHERQVAPHRGP